MIVTGGAGFLGSHLVNELVKKNKVTVIDNLSSGRRRNVNKKALFIERDLCSRIDPLFKEENTVFHLAANPYVREEPVKHLKNIEMTFSVVEACRRKDVEKIIFTSSSTVYGYAKMPADENHPITPISVYGASKAAGEALIISYCHSYGMKSWVYRLANVVGPRLNHGIIFDFIKKLKKNPHKLEILGNGKQEKSYIHVSDCISGMMCGLRARERVNIFNIGSDDAIKALEIATLVSSHMKLKPEFHYTGGSGGWIGDVPRMLLANEKLKNLGWKPKLNSKQAISDTILSSL